MKYDNNNIENSVREFWKKNKIPEKIVEFNSNNKKFYLLDGPPYVNGIPHVGHIKTTTFKDIWGKLKKMQGYSVWFQPGFDCGGLPIENKVEEILNVKTKSDIIEKIGVSKFVKECEKFAKGNEPEWLDIYKKIGAWRGWLSPYLTSENYYIESGWWTVKKIFEKGLLIEGERPGFWCPRCETVLSGFEISDSYEMVEDPSIFIKFKIKDKENEYLLAWTTTPWTLAANVALVVHPDEEYVKIKLGDDKLILAKKRLEIFEEMEMGYTIEEEMKGTALEGMKYEPLTKNDVQEELNQNEKAHKVYLSIPLMKKKVASKAGEKKGIESEEEFSHMVTMDTGTGIVHTAPGHGDVDNRLGKHYDLPEPSTIDEQGKLTTGEFKGVYAKKADRMIIDKLKENGLLLYENKITHSYPMCWRCKTPLLYRMSKQWFLTIEDIRKEILEENENVKWLPDFAKERFHNVVKEAPDWAVTRQRFWGIPLPLWRCEKCNKIKVIGSSEELEKESGEKINDLRKDSVDNIKLKCECGGKMTREEDIMDVWFDSGIAPWASLGYPFKNKEIFEKLWPVDLIDESQDQVKNWFYRLMVAGYATFDEKPFNVVCLNGWTLDGHGKKMSKSVGNVVLAKDAYQNLGADVLRLYICQDIAPWETQKFSLTEAKEIEKSLNILMNTYNYYKEYSEGDYKEEVEDKWILSKLHSLIKKSTEDYENFRFHEVSRDIIDFIVNDFSRTYIKLVRGRGIKKVLQEIFENLMKIMAPITPFIADYIYIDMKEDSVHLEKWPIANDKKINEKLEKQMKSVIEISSVSSNMRKENSIKLRWPLKEIKIDSDIDENLIPVIKNMCNVKNVVFEKIDKGIEFSSGKIELSLEVIENEALARELMREIQRQRKISGLTVGEKIKLELSEKIEEFEEEIKERVDAESISYSEIKEQKGEISFKDKKIKFNF